MCLSYSLSEENVSQPEKTDCSWLDHENQTTEKSFKEQALLNIVFS